MLLALRNKYSARVREPEPVEDVEVAEPEPVEDIEIVGLDGIEAGLSEERFKEVARLSGCWRKVYQRYEQARFGRDAELWRDLQSPRG